MSNPPFLVLGPVVVLLGLVMVVRPRRFLHTTEGWKYDHSPRYSDAYVALIVAQGVGVVVLGIALLITGLLARAR